MKFKRSILLKLEIIKNYLHKGNDLHNRNNVNALIDIILNLSLNLRENFH